MDWLPFAPLAAAALHITEEFVIPGGFPAWYRRYTPDPSRITPRFLAIVNGVLLVACGDIALLGRTPIGAAKWLTIAVIQASNGCWHGWASYRSHTYSPGTITGVAVYLPAAIYGFVEFARSGLASPGTAAGALLIGGSYHFWSAVYHRRVGKKTA